MLTPKASGSVQGHSQSRCTVCHTLLGQDVKSSDGVCDRVTCRNLLKIHKSADLGQNQLNKRADYVALALDRARSAIDEAAETLGIEDLDTVACGIAPYIDLPLQPLPISRREEFEAHLKKIVEDCFDDLPECRLEADAPAGDASNKDYSIRQTQEQAESAALNATCIACQGDCCTQGASRKAFLTKDTIEYLYWRNETLTPEDIVQTYLSFLPGESVVSSCVYHGSQGCVVPREYRADICNSFQCTFRVSLQQELDAKKANQAIVAGVAYDHTDDPEEGSAYLRLVSVTEEGSIQVHKGAKLAPIQNEE
jgi:hypothetical protein